MVEVGVVDNAEQVDVRERLSRVQEGRDGAEGVEQVGPDVALRAAPLADEADERVAVGAPVGPEQLPVTRVAEHQAGEEGGEMLVDAQERRLRLELVEGVGDVGLQRRLRLVRERIRRAQPGGDGERDGVAAAGGAAAVLAQRLQDAEQLLVEEG